MKAGKRKKTFHENKGRVAEIKNILHDIDLVAHKLIESGVQITVDNIDEEAHKYTDRELGSLERALLLSKLKHFETELENRRKQIHEQKNNS